MKRVVLVTLVALLFVACKKKPAETTAPKSHPGCPGDSARSVDDDVNCTCRPGEVLQAGSMQCKDCDPTGSNGVFCDCGSNSLFSMNATLEAQLGLDSNQVQCVSAADAPDGGCADGSYPGAGGCVKCGPNDCGLCGVCDVGGTCVSGQCVWAGACRVETIDPPCMDDGAQVTCAKEDVCKFAKGQEAAFFSLDDYPVGSVCQAIDPAGCTYEGVIEALSQ
jgi:hypothetical protein